MDWPEAGQFIRAFVSEGLPDYPSVCMYEYTDRWCSFVEEQEWTS